MTIPLVYGSQPNMGLHYHPTGPIPTPFDYFTKYEFENGFQLQEEAAQIMRDDIYYVAEQLYEVGCEAINLDTAASAGDAEFWGALQVVEEIKSKLPEMPVEMGMAGEEVIGMHGKLTYQGERLVGMYPHQQVEMRPRPVSTSLVWPLPRSYHLVCRHSDGRRSGCLDAADSQNENRSGQGICSPKIEPEPAEPRQ